MPNFTINELKERIGELPEQFVAAMHKRVKADTKVERLEAQIEKLKIELAAEPENAAEEPPTQEDEIGVLQLEAYLEKAKLELDEAESRAELEFRQNNPKATENNVQAAVCIASQVSELKRKHLQAKRAVKIKKSELQKERAAKFEERRTSRIKSRALIENSALNELQEKLFDLEEQRTYASAEIENTKFTLDAYKLLAALSPLGDT